MLGPARVPLRRSGACLGLVLAVGACGPIGDDAAALDDTLEESDPTETDGVETDDVDPAWRSALYPTDWTPAFTDAEGRFLHDMSYAGYHAGEVPLPALPTPQVSVLDYGADPTGETDSAAAFQAAIHALVEGGTVWVPEGEYTVASTVTVARSGVVVAGAGADRSFVHFTQDTGTAGGAGLRFAGSAPSAGSWLLAVDGQSRATQVELADASGLEVGDRVAVGWTITPEFVDEHGMTGTWQAFNGTWRPFFRRTVLAIEGDVVTLDVPLRYVAKVRDGADLRPDDGMLSEVGLVDLAVSSRVGSAQALAVSRHHAVEFVRVEDSYVLRVASYGPDGAAEHLQSGGLYLLDTRRFTVADTRLEQAQNRGSGGNGYLYEISRSSEVLVRDSVGRGGRHNFIQNWDFGTSGCVFLRTVSTEGRADNGPISVTGASEFHHSLAMANLIDTSTTDDGWRCVNRRSESSGAGHACTESVFWNVRGTGELRSMQAGWGYVVGTGAELAVVSDPTVPDLFFGGQGTEPADWTEGVGLADHLEPTSLYEDQLARRLAR